MLHRIGELSRLTSSARCAVVEVGVRASVRQMPEAM
jgi:hypothetical protein